MISSDSEMGSPRKVKDAEIWVLSSESEVDIDLVQLTSEG